MPKQSTMPLPRDSSPSSFVEPPGGAGYETFATENSPLLGDPKKSGSRVSVGEAPSSSSSPTLSPGSTPLEQDSISAVTDEEAPPLQDTEGESGSSSPRLSNSRIAQIIFVLLLAVFVFNLDGSLVMAAYPAIGSEFNALESASWLFTGFAMAGIATQTLLGRLSDIYGRKPIILFCYATFVIGCVIIGLGQSMIAVILGRVISGSVGAGMTVLVSILITDLLPIREVAAWRSYVNIASTTGRSLGGPLGGWLTDVVGWRWSFLGQIPLLLVAIVLCSAYLPNTLSGAAKTQANMTGREKLKRLDFLGSLTLGLFILTFLLPVEIGGVKIPWTHPLIPSLFAIAASFLGLFVFIEKRWAKEPLLPLELFAKRDTVLCFWIMSCQLAAQMGLMFSVPLYFQVTKRVSNTEAGAHLFPAVVGNAVGGILSGILIKKSGRYKWLIYAATLSSATCYALLLFRWHGDTDWAESLYIIPGGFGSGVSQSAVFIAIQAAVKADLVSSAISMLYLVTGVGIVIGLACFSAVTEEVLRSTLQTQLIDLGLSVKEAAKVISHAASNVEYIYKAKGAVANAIVVSYVDGLWWSHAISLGLSLAALVATIFLREHKL